MIVGVPVESFSGELRVTLVPAVVSDLEKIGVKVLVQEGAGERAGFLDTDYSEQGTRLTPDRSQLFSEADFILCLHTLAKSTGVPDPGDLNLLKPGQIVLGMLNPLGAPEAAQALAEKQVTSFALELLPRITRAQSMDILSSMATIAGYKAVLLAAGALDKMCPMMMTAAGTISPARVFVMGAGVAGLQAIATSRRLGAVVQAYDVRPAVKEQVESLGAKFVELGLDTDSAEGSGGYAQAMDEGFYRRQREMMKEVVSEMDVVITTAAVPGKKAPVLLTEEMVRGMRSGSVILDLAAEGGGNCEVTRAGETVQMGGVTILGPVNLPSTVPYHASQMLSRNIMAFLSNLMEEGKLRLNLEDEVIRDSMLTHQGEVVHPLVRQLLGMNNSDEEERSNF